MLRLILKQFVISFLIITILNILVSSGSEEFSIEIVLIISIMISFINAIYLWVIESLRVTDFRNWPPVILVGEVIAYWLLILLQERLIKLNGVSIRNNQFLDFPFTYLYPFIFLSIVFYIWKRCNYRKGNSLHEKAERLDA